VHLARVVVEEELLLPRLDEPEHDRPATLRDQADSEHHPRGGRYRPFSSIRKKSRKKREREREEEKERKRKREKERERKKKNE